MSDPMANIMMSQHDSKFSKPVSESPVHAPYLQCNTNVDVTFRVYLTDFIDFCKVSCSDNFQMDLFWEAINFFTINTQWQYWYCYLCGNKILEAESFMQHMWLCHEVICCLSDEDIMQIPDRVEIDTCRCTPTIDLTETPDVSALTLDWRESSLAWIRLLFGTDKRFALRKLQLSPSERKNLSQNNGDCKDDDEYYTNDEDKARREKLKSIEELLNSFLHHEPVLLCNSHLNRLVERVTDYFLQNLEGEQLACARAIVEESVQLPFSVLDARCLSWIVKHLHWLWNQFSETERPMKEEHAKFEEVRPDADMLPSITVDYKKRYLLFDPSKVVSHREHVLEHPSTCTKKHKKFINIFQLFKEQILVFKGIIKTKREVLRHCNDVYLLERMLSKQIENHHETLSKTVGMSSTTSFQWKFIHDVLHLARVLEGNHESSSGFVSDKSIKVALTKKKHAILSKLDKIDVQIIQKVAVFEQLKMDLLYISAYDYRSHILPFLSSFVQVRINMETDVTSWASNRLKELIGSLCKIELKLSREASVCHLKLIKCTGNVRCLLIANTINSLGEWPCAEGKQRFKRGVVIVDAEIYREYISREREKVNQKRDVDDIRDEKLRMKFLKLFGGVLKENLEEFEKELKERCTVKPFTAANKIEINKETAGTKGVEETTVRIYSSSCELPTAIADPTFGDKKYDMKDQACAFWRSLSDEEKNDFLSVPISSICEYYQYTLCLPEFKEKVLKGTAFFTFHKTWLFYHCVQCDKPFPNEEFLIMHMACEHLAVPLGIWPFKPESISETRARMFYDMDWRPIDVLSACHLLVNHPYVSSWPRSKDPDRTKLLKDMKKHFIFLLRQKPPLLTYPYLSNLVNLTIDIALSQLPSRLNELHLRRILGDSLDWFCFLDEESLGYFVKHLERICQLSAKVLDSDCYDSESIEYSNDYKVNLQYCYDPESGILKYDVLANELWSDEFWKKRDYLDALSMNEDSTLFLLDREKITLQNTGIDDIISWLVDAPLAPKVASCPSKAISIVDGACDLGIKLAEVRLMERCTRSQFYQISNMEELNNIRRWKTIINSGLREQTSSSSCYEIALEKRYKDLSPNWSKAKCSDATVKTRKREIIKENTKCYLKMWESICELMSLEPHTRRACALDFRLFILPIIRSLLRTKLEACMKGVAQVNFDAGKLENAQFVDLTLQIQEFQLEEWS